jgi:hypothetical protein
VAEVVVLPRLADRSLARGDGVAVDEDLDRAEVALEVANVLIGPGQRVRGDLRVVLGGFRGRVTKPG